MATTITNAIFEYSFKASSSKANSLGHPTTCQIDVSDVIQYAAGTFSKAFLSGGRTGPETFDASATLTDPEGNTFTFATVKFYFVRNTHATNALTVNASGSNLLGPVLTIQAGKCVLLPIDLTVDGTHKNIVFGSGTYDLVLLGV